MAVKEIFVFVACFYMLCGFGDSVNIQCKYGTDSYIAVGFVYECYPQNTLNIKSRESAVINSNNGSHLSGKSNADVTCFYSWDSSRVIEYFPRNLDNIFINLKMIYIKSGHLKEIQQSDLRPFSKLVRLDLANNDIEFLEDGLFAYNPELAFVSFWSNKIIHIGSQVFENLNKLTWLYLQSNTCINIYADNNQAEVREIISQAKSKCQLYSDKHTIYFINDKIDHAELKLSNAITDLSKATASQSEIIENKLKTSYDNLQNIIQEVTKTQNGIQQKSVMIQNSINQLINSQTQTCSAISENVSKVSQSISKISQEITTKSDSTDIKNSLSNLKSDISSKFSTIGSDVSTMTDTMMSIKNDLASEISEMDSKVSNFEATMKTSMSSIELSINSRITAIESTMNTKMTTMDERITNLTSILEDFIKTSTSSSDYFQSDLRNRLQFTNYKIDKTSIIQDYSKSMLIGSCALLITLVLLIIYKKILFRPDDLD